MNKPVNLKIFRLYKGITSQIDADDVDDVREG